MTVIQILLGHGHQDGSRMCSFPADGIKNSYLPWPLPGEFLKKKSVMSSSAGDQDTPSLKEVADQF